MKKLLLPLILALLGVGGGVGAGMFLIPPPVAEDLAMGPCGDVPSAEEMIAAADPHAPAEGEDAAQDPAEGEEGAPVEAGDATGFEYVRMNNQFIIPVVQDGTVKSMVILSISVEVMSGTQDMVFTYEPKMRDVFLQVLFDHANAGGFEGIFTSAENMRDLRRALRLSARDAVGEQVHDVLITDIVRQDV